MPAGDDEAKAFARSFASFLEWVNSTGSTEATNPVVARIREHLGAAGLEHSVISRQLPPFEQVNLQVALDAWKAESGRAMVAVGYTMPPHFGPVELSQFLHGDHLPPVRESAPDLVDLPTGPGRTLACWRSALLLVSDARGRYVVMVREPQRHHEPDLSVEVAGLPTGAAQEVLDELDALRRRLNVYRGQVLELTSGMGIVVTFPELPPTSRVDVVLPDDVLRRVERHTLDIAARREALLAAGQHLKRGLLLYGPPGTGKTHTTRYVVQHLPGSTVLLLSGRSLHLISAVTDLARDLQPAVVVLEDVDLVAEDRTHGAGPSPVLFELLDAMDGAASDADLLFLLTTNRADLLESALAARPGRVDVAVEIGLPDAASRRRLLDVYARRVPLTASEADLESAVERTEGVTASFIKELLRRAVLEALDHDGHGEEPLTAVTGEHLSRALDDLLDAAQGVTRALLGVPSAQTATPDSPLPPRAAGRAGRSMAFREID